MPSAHCHSAQESWSGSGSCWRTRSAASPWCSASGCRGHSAPPSSNRRCKHAKGSTACPGHLLSGSPLPRSGVVAAVGAGNAARRPDGHGEADARPSLVVLPFDNMNDDKEQEYLANGVHRGFDNRTGAPDRSLCCLSQCGLRLQGQGDKACRNCSGAGSPLPGGRLDPARRRQHAHQRATDRRNDIGTSVGRALRSC